MADIIGFAATVMAIVYWVLWVCFMFTHEPWDRLNINRFILLCLIPTTLSIGWFIYG